MTRGERHAKGVQPANFPTSKSRPALKNFKQQAYDILLQRILGCEPGYEPGARLDVPAIAEELGISVTPIKESLLLLQGEGLIRINDRSGTFIASLDHEDLDDLIDLLRELELAALRLARKRTIKPDLEMLRLSVVDAESGIDHGLLGESVSANLGFHGALVALSGNRRLIDLYGSPRAFLVITVYRNNDPGVRHQLLSQHREILDALQGGDWERAADLAALHWEETRRNAHLALDRISGTLVS